MKKITIKDIPTKEVLEYQNKWQKNCAKSIDMPYCYEALPYPDKVIFRKMEKLFDQGYLEYGVSLRTAWLTEKGKELIQL